MLALVQPFGLHSPGGGPRILRSLLGDANQPYLSVCTALAKPDVFDDSCEVHLPIRPYLGRVEHTRLARPLSVLTLMSASRLTARLTTLFRERGVTSVHAIPHGLDFWAAFEAARQLGLPYVLNVHDDMTYNLHDRVYLNRAMDRLATVWREADGRMVISEAMGETYNARYGTRPFEVVTDGLEPAQVATAPRSRPAGRLSVYFMGSVHLSYRRNFQSLLDALGLIADAQPERDVRFIVRGGLPFPLDAGSVDLELRGWGTQEEVEADLDDADLLYFPLPFEPEHDAFVRLSLSTKMVTYLGSGLPILYHGPDVAAAARLLDDNDAGLLACTTDAHSLAGVLEAADAPRLDAAVRGALDLAQQQFMLVDQRDRFWREAFPTAVSTKPAA